MTNHLQLPQDTLDRLSMLPASQEERDAALAKVVVISKDDLYRILSRRASSQDIDEDWQAIMQAGTIVASQPDRPDGDDTKPQCFFCFKNIHDHCRTSAEAVTCLERLPTRDGAEGAGDVKRCEICNWPLSTKPEYGCVPGDCAYRPDDPAEQERIRKRRAELAAPPKPAPDVCTCGQSGHGNAHEPGCPRSDKPAVRAMPAPDAMQDALKRIEAMQVGHAATIAREALELIKAASAPAPSPDGAGDFPRFLGSSSENGSPRVARCVFAADLSGEDHRKIATALIRPSPVVAAEPETEQQIEERLMKQDAADLLRLIDYIADKIGLPHDEELSRDNFNARLASPPVRGDREAIARLAERIVDTCRECRLGKTQASVDYNFDNNRAQCIKFVTDSILSLPAQPGERETAIRECIVAAGSCSAEVHSPGEMRSAIISDLRGLLGKPGAGEREHHKLDNDRQVFFYEQDFYVLSNFSAFTLTWQGKRFDTSEAAYHWMKFMPDEIGIAAMIREAPSAHEAFKLAERYKSVRRKDWDSVKIGIMRDILRAKAQQHEYVRRKLLATGDRELIEDSWRDDFWGWGPKRDGRNALGNLWMEIRDELRSRQASQETKS